MTVAYGRAVLQSWTLAAFPSSHTDGMSALGVHAQLPRYVGSCLGVNSTWVLALWQLRATGAGSSPPGIKGKVLLIHLLGIGLNETATSCHRNS